MIAPKRLKLRLSGSARKSQKRNGATNPDSNAEKSSIIMQFAVSFSSLTTSSSSSSLQDDETFVVEDLISDYIEAKAVAGGAVTEEVALTVPVVGSVRRLVALSEGLAQSDAGFARQVRRKFL
jgi:hypothetical protein